ncbi:hypothetical protein HDU91_001052 [Kappamyces sp. JEL0680]|nr:hypothetical protein HDU91_001052 [Kappamyces sp. JEL0680]
MSAQIEYLFYAAILHGIGGLLAANAPGLHESACAVYLLLTKAIQDPKQLTQPLFLLCVVAFILLFLYQICTIAVGHLESAITSDQMPMEFYISVTILGSVAGALSTVTLVAILLIRCHALFPDSLCYSPNYPLFSLCVMVSFFLYAVLLVLASISFLWKIYSARQVRWSAFVSDVVVRQDGIRIAILFGQSGFIMYSGLYIALKENTYVTVQMLNVFQWYFATSLFVFLQHSYVSARAIMKNGISDGPAQNKNLYQTASVVNQRASAESLSTKASGTG